MAPALGFTNLEGLEEGERDDLRTKLQTAILLLESAAKKKAKGRGNSKVDHDRGVEKELGDLMQLITSWSQRPKPTTSTPLLQLTLDPVARRVIRDLIFEVRKGVKDYHYSQTDDFVSFLQAKGQMISGAIQNDGIDSVEIWEPDSDEEKMAAEGATMLLAGRESPPPSSTAETPGSNNDGQESDDNISLVDLAWEPDIAKSSNEKNDEGDTVMQDLPSSGG